MATRAEIIERVASLMEHQTVRLGELGNVNGCNMEESVKAVHEGNDRTSEGDSFTESPPSAGVVIEQKGEAEERNEVSTLEKQPLEDVIGGEEPFKGQGGKAQSLTGKNSEVKEGEVIKDDSECIEKEVRIPLEPITESKGEEESREQTVPDGKKPDDGIHVATEELPGDGAVAAFIEETPNTSQLEDSFQQEEGIEDEQKQNHPVFEEADQLRCEAGNMEIEKLNEISDFELKEQVIEDGGASTAVEMKVEDEPKTMPPTEGKKNDALAEGIEYEKEEHVIEEMPTAGKEIQPEDIIAGHSSEEKNLLPTVEAERTTNLVDDNKSESFDKIPSIECKEQFNEDGTAMIFEETQTEDIIKANESMEIATAVDQYMEKENLPLIQEAGQINGLDDGIMEKFDAVSSLITEDLTHEEHESHEVEETQVEDKTEASESTEITTAGLSSAELNLLQHQSEKGLKNASVDAEVEMPNEISKFVSEQGNGEQEATVTQEECEINHIAIGEKGMTEQIIKETNAEEAIGVLARRTEIADSSKEVHEEQFGAEIKVSMEHDAEGSSANPDDHHFTEKVANLELHAARDEKDAEISESENDTGNMIAVEAAEATMSPAEGESVAHSAEHVEHGSTSEEGIAPELFAPIAVESDKGKMDESKVSDENTSTENIQIDECGKIGPIPASTENEKVFLEESIAYVTVSTNEEDQKLTNITDYSKPDACAIEEQHRTNIVLKDETEEEAMQYDIKTETSLGEGEEKCLGREDLQTNGAPKSEIAVNGSVEYTLQAEEEVDVRSHTETIQTEMLEEGEETTEKDISEAEVPKLYTEYEDAIKQKTSEEVATSLESEKQCEKNAEANDFTEKVPSEEVHGVENLTRDYTVGITEQCKIEEQNVLEEDSPDKNIQMDESGCKKDIDEAFNDAESFQSGSETEKIIWEETTASKSPENKLEEDNMPENVHDFSKQSSYTIQEKVADSAHREISSISEPAPEVQNCEVSGTKQETLHIPNSSPVSGVDIHSQETINSEVQERDGKTTQEITSQTEVHELSTELDGIHTQTTSNETTASTGSEKLCKETTIMSNSVEEKVSCEEVDEGEGKTYESSLEEVTILKEIHVPSPVECTTIEDTDTGPGLDCIQVEVETLHAEEIETESGKYETMEEVSEKDRLQEEVTVSIPQTEDTREESSSNLIRQQNTIGQHNEEKAEETASQLLENQHEESKGDHEEAFHSISPEIGEVDAVETTFEVEKSEATTNTGGIEVVPMEVDVSDSQFTESVTVEETKSGESRDMEEQVLTLAPTAIAEKSRNETVVEAEKISEQTKTGTYMTLQNEALELSSAAELTTERLHEETIDSIPQTENAREESPSDLTSHQCIPMLHGAEDDEPSLVQGRHDGHEQTNEASEEASHSIRPETELAEVVEITLEEEMYEVIGNTRENEVVPREADVSDSQLTESVAEEEIKFSRSRELAVQVLSSIPTAIPESCEKEIADMVEKTDAATTQQNETLELSYAEEATIRIPQSEDAREESSSDLTNQQCIPTQLDAGEEEPTKIQVWHDGHEQIKGAPEGVGHSIRLETEVTDALEATFEEEKFEVTGNSRKLGVSRKVYISDSRLTNPVAEEKISIDQSRELLTQFLSPVTLGITESVEDETVEMVEENKADAEMIQQNEISELSSIAVSTKVRDATSNGDPQANESMEDLPNEANKGSVNTGEDSKHEPMKEESGMTTGAYSSVGEACMLTSSLTDISPERTEVVQETSPGIQVEEKPSGLENLESLNLIVNEVTAGAEKLWENIIDTKDTNQYESPNDEEHPGEKGVNASERTKEAPKNNVSPEGGDCAIVSGVVEDEETKENNEEVSGSSNELSIKEEAQEEHGFDSIEQTRASVVVIKNESIKEAGVQEIEDPGYNDADAGGGREIIQDDISNKKDEDEYGKAHEGERNELVSVSCESSTAKFETSEEDGFKIVLVECSLEKEPNPNRAEPSSIAADRNIDGDQKLVSDAPANNVEEHLQEKIFEKAETPCEESSVVSLPMEEDETVEDLVREIPTGSLDVESRSIVLDAIASDADSKCHSDNALELNDIKGGGILVEEKHDAIGKANDPWRDIKEELNAEGGNTEEIQAEYQEKDPTPVEDIIAKILYEQIQGEIFEPEARITSKSETPVLDILESDQTKGEQVIASTEEMKEVENIEKEISEEADARCENIDPAAPLITETCVLTNELEKTSKEEKLQYNEVLLSTAAGASEATCMEMTEDISTKEVESVSDDIIHEVTHQLEDIEIKETHFNLTPMDSAAGEQNEKIIEADEILPDIAPREEKEETIHDDNHKLKGEEVMKEKRETLKSTIGELQFQEVTKEHAINEVTAQNESDKKFFGRQETSEISLPEGEPTTEEWMHEKKLQEVKSPPVHNAFLEISEEIKQQESISAATCKEYFSLKMEEIADSTSEKPQESVLEHENPLPGYGEEKVEYRMGENESKEHEFMNETPFSPSNLLKLSVTEKLQMLTYTTGTKAEEAEMAKADETKTDEEYGENEADEHQHTELISERDTPLMVEPSKDSDVKAHHKKSHNILSGVGSRVKHSISKVKKAITGKSSCSKTPPPQQSL